MLGEPFSSLIVVFRKLRTARGDGLLVHFLLGSITLIPPTVSMKPLSYLKVTAIMSLIITLIDQSMCASLFPHPLLLEHVLWT